MFLNYLPRKWLKSLWAWLTDKKGKEQSEEVKEVLSKEPILKEPPPPIRKGSLEDIRDFCDEIRKDLSIRKRLDGKTLQVDELRKKTDNRLYVEIGNLKDKIERFLGDKKR